MEGKVQGKILQFLDKNPGKSVNQILEEVTCDQKYAYRILGELVKTKAVVKTKKFYTLNALGKKLAAQAFIKDYMDGKVQF